MCETAPSMTHIQIFRSSHRSCGQAHVTGKVVTILMLSLDRLGARNNIFAYANTEFWPCLATPSFWQTRESACVSKCRN